MRYALIVLSGKPRRFSGFLHSVAMEAAPGVFLAADLNRSAFDRVWMTLAEWHDRWPEVWIVAVLPASRPRHPPQIRCLGMPARKLAELDGMHVLLVEK